MKEHWAARLKATKNADTMANAGNISLVGLELSRSTSGSRPLPTAATARWVLKSATGFYQPRIAILSSIRKADCSVGVYPPTASASRVVDHLAGQAADESSGLQAKPEIYPTASPTLRPTYREMLPRIPNQ